MLGAGNLLQFFDMVYSEGPTLATRLWLLHNNLSHAGLQVVFIVSKKLQMAFFQADVLMQAQSFKRLVKYLPWLQKETMMHLNCYLEPHSGC